MIELHHLEFAERDEGPHVARVPAARPHALPVPEDEGAARAAFHLRNDRQRAPALTWRGRPRSDIANRVADEGHGVIVEPCQHDAAKLAGGDRTAVLADNVDYDILGEDMIVRRCRTLGGDEADFLARIDARKARSQTLPDKLAAVVGHRLP